MDFYCHKNEDFTKIPASDLRVGDYLRHDAGRRVSLSGAARVIASDAIDGTIYVTIAVVQGMYIKSSAHTIVEVEWDKNVMPIIVAKTEFDPDEIISILKRQD